ncbi:YegP family protein [Methylobacterium nodulans]|uniref:DUF1508 domain-containing protein n=1 Tax=Methylobacterium nodulans (strain LMG 21967 / CNCM I-2342 / ORS 2060) TaxID=460265 RepID=B8IMI8_METNO|nr:hypothetical protein [Methylobacterium nodulans]ACL58374.1 conserved hypothetical protein [Methylobacterium nodulans ORS 2060]
MQFLVEQDEPGQWRWRLIGRKGETLMLSDEIYDTKPEAADAACLHAHLIEAASRRMVAPVSPPKRAPRLVPRRPIFTPH